MSSRALQLLHVEDDPLDHKVVEHHLKALSEFSFTMNWVTSEAEALLKFRPKQFDLVLLDYHLAQGDGLHLLRQLRQLDPIVPIIAISGVAPAEVAAELVRAGADDYFDKRDLASQKLASSIRSAIRRADTVRQRAAQQPYGETGLVEQGLRELCQAYASAGGLQFLERLDALEGAAKQSGLNARQLEGFFIKVCDELAGGGEIPPAAAQRLFRPLFLDLIVRLFGDVPAANP